MDLHNLKTYLQPTRFDELTGWDPTWSWLGGGTWLMSQPQPNVTGLVDLERFNWSEIQTGSDHLTLGSACTLAQILSHVWPAEWVGISALLAAIDSLASFKVAQQATIGGNLCLALSVGSVAPVMIVMDAVYEVWSVNGSVRQIPARQFQTGSQQTQLQPGEALRQIRIPIKNLCLPTIFQRQGIAATDPALAIVVGSQAGLRIRLGLQASVLSPQLLEFAQAPTSAELTEALQAQSWLADFRCGAAYRQHLTRVLIQRSLNWLAIDRG